jgi:hypothetical protein
MIALCMKHHVMADRGVFSRAQLRALKSSPHPVEEVKAKFEWARPKQPIRLGGFYMGGKNVSMTLGVKWFVEEVVVLRENSLGLLELLFILRDEWMKKVAVMEKNTFAARPDRFFDLQVDAGATRIRIRQQKRKVLLDLQSSRKTPEELAQLLKGDWERAQKTIQKKVASDSTIGPIFRDYILGPLTAAETDNSGTPSRWRDESSGEMVESRRHLTSFILDWALEYCVDDEGLIPVLDFRNVLAYVLGRKIEFRNGVDVGQKSMGFGACFSPDSPHPGDSPDDGRPRKPFCF